MADTRRRLLNACFALMVAVARSLLRAGVSFREFDEVARAAFIRVASSDYGLRGRRTNASRVSAMTGISRKQVRLFRDKIKKYGLDARIELSPLGDLLHHWSTDTRLRDKRGGPMALPFSDGDISFESLVRERLGDLPANATRVELLRCGAISQDPDGLLHLERREVVPETSYEKLVSSVSFNLVGLASTIAFNSNPDRTGPGRIERFVQSPPLSTDEAKRMRDILRQRIVSFTRGLDDLFPTDAHLIAPGKRVGVGVYYYEEDGDAE